MAQYAAIFSACDIDYNHFFKKAISSYNLFYNTEKDEVIFLKTKELGNVFILTKEDFADLQHIY